jgi:hypothetical protein
MRSHRCFRTVVLLLAASLSDLAAAQPVSEAPPDTALIRLAAALAEAAPEIAQVWPGYWPAEQPFMLLRRDTTALLVALWTPPPVYRPIPDEALPPSLQGHAYVRDGYLPEFAGRNSYPGEPYDVGGRDVFAMKVPMKRPTLFGRADFFIHELFHLYQRREPDGWAETAEDTIVGLSPKDFIDDPSLATDPDFQARIVVEHRLLQDALTASSQDSLRLLLRTYLAARAERIGDRADIEAVERRYERREGTASFVGYRAAAATVSEPDQAAHAIRDELDATLEHGSGLDGPFIMTFRWRLYETGAALSLLLDRLGVPDWQRAVERGRHLDALVADAVAFDAERDAPLAIEALDRYGHEQLLRTEHEKD